MTVLQINSTFGIGSTGAIVKAISDLCHSSGIKCINAVVCGNEGNCYDMHSLISQKIHSLFSRVSGRQGYYSTIKTLGLIGFIRKYKPDVVHLHNLHSSYICLPVLLRYLSRSQIPVIVTLHDCWFYTGGCTHYTHSNCYKWENGCGHCPQRYEEFPAYLFDASNQILTDRKSLFGAIHNLTAVGVSQWIIDEAKKTVFQNARCVTIHNGIDINFFRPTKSSFRFRLGIEDKFVILAPANKWFLDINRDTLNYFSENMTEDMCMIFIGNGADSKRFTDKMINVGFVSLREEIREIYSAADVLINCTREESLSLLNVEVQACGTPVVTYSNTGVKETVDNKCGFAVKNGDYKELFDKMMSIKREGKNSYSENCIKWVVSEFSEKTNYKKYIELYKSINSND